MTKTTLEVGDQFLNGRIEIIKRTDKTVTIRDFEGNVTRAKIRFGSGTFETCERVEPNNFYSKFITEPRGEQEWFDFGGQRWAQDAHNPKLEAAYAALEEIFGGPGGMERFAQEIEAAKKLAA